MKDVAKRTQNVRSHLRLYLNLLYISEKRCLGLAKKLSEPFHTNITSLSGYATSPMEIPSSSHSRPQSPSCAYPSWPRRASLSSNSSSSSSEEDDRYHQSSSFIISDEELFPDVFDDADCTPPATPHSHSSRSPASPSMLCDMVVENGSFMRQLMVEEKTKKERRRRKSSSSSKKSRSGSGTSKHMSPILEVGE